MRNFLRNLRMPGRRPYTTRYNPYVGRPSPRRRQFSLGRIERPQPKREWNIPWRRIGTWSAGVVTTGAVLYGVAWLATGDTFRVLEIDVTGAEIEHPHAIAFASRAGGDSMFLLDLAEAEERVASLPGIKSATVNRSWPRGLDIAVTEHQAWGYWQVGSRALTVDENGQVLEHARPAPEDAPVIVELAAQHDADDGPSVDADTVRLVARLLEDRTFQRMAVEPSAFVFRADRGLTVVADDAPNTIFGDSSNYEFKVQAWQGLVHQIREDDIEAREIDLRFGRNVVLR